MFLGKGEGGRVLGTGEAGGVSEDAGDLRAKELVGGPEQESGIDPARVGYESRGPGLNQLVKLPLFVNLVGLHPFSPS